MKSSYELAMERLNKTAPTVKVSAAVKQQLAELDAKYTAKIAEREIALNSEIARVAQDTEKARALQEQLLFERKKLQAELEDKKDRLRSAGK
jgi:chromosome segregation ATPase